MPVNYPTASSTACTHTSAVFTPPTAASVYMWYKVASAGSYQNFCNLGTAPNLDFYFGTNGNITFDRDFSTTNGRWNLTVANQGVTPSATQWRFIAVTHPGTTGAAVFYHSAPTDPGPMLRTTTVGTTPSGSVVTSGTHALHVGNYNAHDAGFGGAIAYYGFHSVQLTEGELYEAMWRGWTGRGLLFHSPLDTTAGPDLSGSALALTVNGSAATYTTDGPPVNPAWRSAGDSAIPASAAADQEVAPSGIGVTSAEGTPSLDPGNVNVAPGGLGVGTGEGTPSLAPGNLDVTPTGINVASGEGAPTLAPGGVSVSTGGLGVGTSEGAPTLAPGGVSVAAGGIAVGSAAGAPSLSPGNLDVTPGGIGVGVAVGAPALAPGGVSITTGGQGITSAPGAPTLAPGGVDVAPGGISVSGAPGAPTLVGEGTAAPTGLGITASPGTPTLAPGGVSITPTGLGVVTGLGAPALGPGLAVPGLGVTVALGSHALAPGAVSVTPTGLSVSMAAGSPGLAPGGVSITPSGISVGTGEGAPVVGVAITPAGVGVSVAMGGPTLAPGNVNVAPGGQARTVSLGAPTLAPGGVSVTPTGTAITVAMGTAALAPGGVSVSPTGLSVTSAEGSPAATAGNVNVTPAGLAVHVGMGDQSGGLNDVVSEPVGALEVTAAAGRPVLTAAKSAAFLYAADRRPDTSIRMCSEDGVWMEVGKGAARGITHQGLSLTANRGGPDTCSFTLLRDPTHPWPDMAAFNAVVVEHAGKLVWSGRLREAPGQTGSTNSIGMMASGWQHHMDDALSNLGFVHARIGEWKDARDVGDPGSWAGTGTVTNEGGKITFGYPTGTNYTQYDSVGVTIDTGEWGPGVRQFSADFSMLNHNDFIYLYIRAHERPDAMNAGNYTDMYGGLPGSSISSDPANPTRARCAVPAAEGYRYVSVFAYCVAASGTTGMDHLITMHRIALFADPDYESSYESVLTASDVVRKVVASGGVPLLDSSTDEVEDTTFAIPDFWPQSFASPRATVEAVNAFHDYQQGVDVDRRVFFRAPPDTADLEVGEWSGAEFTDATASSGDDVFNQVVVEGTGGDGNTLQVVRYSADAAPDLATVVNVGGVSNGTFESSTTGWTTVSGSISREVSPESHSGTYGLRLNTSTVITTTLSNLTAGRSHTVTIWVRRGTGPTFALRLTAEDGGEVLGAVNIGTEHAANTWARYQLTFMARASTATLRVNNSGAGDLANIDDVSISRVDVNVVDRHGFTRATRLPVNAGLTPAAAAAIGDVWLRNHLTTPLKGSLTVTGQGGVREAMGGAGVLPGHLLLRYGARVRMTNMVDPDTGAWGREGQVASVSWSEDSGQVVVEIDNERHRVEAFLERLNALASLVG